jgi:hypothetical protein
VPGESFGSGLAHADAVTKAATLDDVETSFCAGIGRAERAGDDDGYKRTQERRTQMKPL